jgi:nucleotide-binding universal stress UspA family protein
MSTIVVGVDRSEGAKAALRFALQEAQLRRAKLRVVHAWQYGTIGIAGTESFYPAVGADLSEVRDAAEQALEATLHDALPDTDSVEIERRVVEGRPAGVLVNESSDADLIVVGSRGHGGFTGLLLGSVSQQVSHHAECPVVIVHSSEVDGGDATSR